MTSVATPRPFDTRPAPSPQAGITKYGLAVNGTVVKDSAENGIGIMFSCVYSWSSDRDQQLDGPGPDGRRRVGEFDTQQHSLRIVGDAVQLTVHSMIQGSGYRSLTTNLDAAGTQLVFSLSGPGPADPETRLVLWLVGAVGQAAWGAAARRHPSVPGAEPAPAGPSAPAGFSTLIGSIQ